MTPTTMPTGLADKLYWRQLWPFAKFHCFKKHSRGGYISLCGGEEIPRSMGQRCSRPPPYKRCAICDGLEMKRRGWKESGPDSPNSV